MAKDKQKKHEFSRARNRRPHDNPELDQLAPGSRCRLLI